MNPNEAKPKKLEKNARFFFQKLSYLQYPLLFIGFCYIGMMYYDLFVLDSKDSVLYYFNQCFVFMGLSISFSSLQDPTKTQNKFSRKIWENPKKGRIALILMTILTLSLIVFGLFGTFSSEDSRLKEISTGYLMLGLGLVGALKTTIEMREHHKIID